MIIIKLMGGLGNQMFQYAFGRNLSLTHRVPLTLDASTFHRQEMITERNYGLQAFDIKAESATPNQIELLKSTKLSVWQKAINKLVPFAYAPVVYEPAAGFSDRKLTKLKQLHHGYFEGYWQSEQFFQEHKSRIAADFSFASPPTEENHIWANHINGTPSVSVHLRRGDYVNNPAVAKIHGYLGAEYYQRAISLIRKHEKDMQLFVFSDDVAWTKQHMKFEVPTHYVHHNALIPHEDMRLMSLCRHNIIANSSFSWWGAYLNKNPNKIVVAPRRWFKDSQKDTQRIIPNAWLTI